MFLLIAGTSFSAPFVTGVAAKIWAARRQCTGAQVREALEQTALDVGASGRDTESGNGLVQAVAAYEYLLTFPSPCGTGAVSNPTPSVSTRAPSASIPTQDSQFTCQLIEDDERFKGQFACTYDLQPYPFPNVPSWLLAVCETDDFVIPTSSECVCGVFIDNEGSSDACSSCSFLETTSAANVPFDIAFDCSNLLYGDCVGRDESGSCISNKDETDNGGNDAPTASSDGNPTVYDNLASFEDLSYATLGVQLAGLQNLLDTEKASLTLFAPSNDGFLFGLEELVGDELASEFLFAYFNEERFLLHLTQLMRSHVVEKELLKAEVPSSKITMLSGEKITVDASKVVTSEMSAANGVLQVINTLLVPSFLPKSIVDLDSDFSLFSQLIVSSGLDETFRDGAFTLFTPVNEVFDALPSATMDELNNNPETLQLVLLQHASKDLVTSRTWTDGGTGLSMLEGALLTFSVGDKVMVNGVQVVRPDMLSMLEIRHGINGLLIPDGLGLEKGPLVDVPVTDPIDDAGVGSRLTSGSHQVSRCNFVWQGVLFALIAMSQI
jgi:uncharacterized surface protein with fasciclin (FAS1) repeats